MLVDILSSHTSYLRSLQILWNREYRLHRFGLTNGTLPVLSTFLAMRSMLCTSEIGCVRTNWIRGQLQANRRQMISKRGDMQTQRAEDRKDLEFGGLSRRKEDERKNGSILRMKIGLWKRMTMKFCR